MIRVYLDLEQDPASCAGARVDESAQEDDPCREQEEIFHHEPKVLTVGELRRALDGIPEALPIRVAIAESPGNSIPGRQVWDDRYIVTQAERDAQQWADVLGCDHTADEFLILGGFQAGDYYRPVEEG